MFNYKLVAHELKKIAERLDMLDLNLKQLSFEDYMKYLAKNLEGKIIPGTSGLHASFTHVEGSLYISTLITDSTVLSLKQKSFSQLPEGPDYLKSQKNVPIEIGFIITDGTRFKIAEFDGGVDIPCFYQGGRLYCCDPMDDGWIGAASMIMVPAVMQVEEEDIEDLVNSRAPAEKYVEAFTKGAANLINILKDAYSFNVLSTHEDEGYVVTDHADNDYGK